MAATYLFIWVIIPCAIYCLYEKLKEEEGRKEVEKFLKWLFTTKDGWAMILLAITFLLITSIPAFLA